MYGTVTHECYIDDSFTVAIISFYGNFISIITLQLMQIVAICIIKIAISVTNILKYFRSIHARMLLASETKVKLCFKVLTEINGKHIEMH